MTTFNTITVFCRLSSEVRICVLVTVGSTVLRKMNKLNYEDFEGNPWDNPPPGVSRFNRRYLNNCYDQGSLKWARVLPDYFNARSKTRVKIVASSLAPPHTTACKWLTVTPPIQWHQGESLPWYTIQILLITSWEGLGLFRGHLL